MNLYVAIAGAAVVLASYAGTFYVGKDYGESKAEAQQQSNQDLAEQAAQKTAGIAAAAISNIKIQHQTVTQKVIHEIQTNTVYAKCEHPDVVFDAINRALTGTDASAGGKLPATDKPVRQDVRNDNAKTDRSGVHVSPVPSVNRP